MKVSTNNQGDAMSRLSVKKRSFRAGGGAQNGSIVRPAVNSELNSIMSLVNGAPTASLTNMAKTLGNPRGALTPTPPPEERGTDGEGAPQSVSSVFGGRDSGEGEGGSDLAFTDELPDSSEDKDGGLDSLRSSVDTTATGNSILYRLDTGVNGASQQDIIEHLQAQVLRLQEALHSERSAKSNKQPQKLVSGSQFRITGKGESRCEDCQIMGGNLKKSRETIRGLKVQLARLEDKYVGLRKSKNLSDDPLVPPPQDLDALQQKVMDLEVENANLLKNARTDQLTIESLQKMLLEWQIKDEAAKENIAQLGQNMGHLQDENLDLKRSREKLREELGQYRVQLEAALSQLSDHDQSHSVKNDEMDTLRGLLRDAEAEIDTLRGERRALEEDLDNAATKVAVSEQGRLAATEQANAVGKERDAYLAEKLTAQAAQAAAEESLGASEAEVNRLSADLMDTKGKVVELANENVALMSELSRLRNQLDSQDQKNGELSKMIEKSMNSSVRLCVVAPAVNVQVSGKSARFKGGLEDGKLNTFLKEQVLSKYSFLFEQKAEGVAPDGRPLSEWLQGLLGEMQVTIEKHVNNAMDKE